MIAQSKESKTKANSYHLKIVLEGIRPPIWRRLQVPGDANLGWLDAAIQVAMGWTNSHLHAFQIGDSQYSDPSFQLQEFEEDPPVFDEKKTLLQQIAPSEGNVFMYQYDFGDSWFHRIEVEKILPHDPKRAKIARCLDGGRACPPEDCGSVPGYMDLLKIINDPGHVEYKNMMEWLGGTYDPEAFSTQWINSCLLKLKWPHCTVNDLAKVLMTRDGYRG